MDPTEGGLTLFVLSASLRHEALNPTQGPRVTIYLEKRANDIILDLEKREDDIISESKVIY